MPLSKLLNTLRSYKVHKVSAGRRPNVIFTNGTITIVNKCKGKQRSIGKTIKVKLMPKINHFFICVKNARARRYL